ncbi:MAG TPA: restriction endonuclease subunit S, partial [Synergistales bacterium]|nr:restriction endonuclease subunit S [Synergistales bacterium]
REFLSCDDWRIELLLSEENEEIQRFRESAVRKVRIREVAEVFRGKSILKKNADPGRIGVLNISDLEGGEIDWGKIATIDEDERKAGRYILREGDVLLSCRGTTVKSAVFRKQEHPVIPSANLLVIRPDASVSGDFLRIFFESPSGDALIRSFQRGTVLMNLNHSDIMEMEMPLPPMERQLEIVGRYFSERKKYEEATRRWEEEKERAYRELLEQVQDASAESGG